MSVGRSTSPPFVPPSSRSSTTPPQVDVAPSSGAAPAASQPPLTLSFRHLPVAGFVSSSSPASPGGIVPAPHPQAITPPTRSPFTAGQKLGLFAIGLVFALGLTAAILFCPPVAAAIPLFAALPAGLPILLCVGMAVVTVFVLVGALFSYLGMRAKNRGKDYHKPSEEQTAQQKREKSSLEEDKLQLEQMLGDLQRLSKRLLEEFKTIGQATATRLKKVPEPTTIPIAGRLTRGQKWGLAGFVAVTVVGLVAAILFCPPIAAGIALFAVLPTWLPILLFIGAAVVTLLTPFAAQLYASWMRARNCLGIYRRQYFEAQHQTEHARAELSAQKAYNIELEAELKEVKKQLIAAAQALATSAARSHGHVAVAGALARHLTALSTATNWSLVSGRLQYNTAFHSAQRAKMVLDSETETILKSNPNLEGLLHTECAGKISGLFKVQSQGVSLAFNKFASASSSVRRLESKFYYTVRSNAGGFAITAVKVQAAWHENAWRVFLVQNQLRVVHGNADPTKWVVTSRDASFHALYTCPTEKDLDEIAGGIQSAFLSSFFPSPEPRQTLLKWYEPVGGVVNLVDDVERTISCGTDGFYKDAKRDGLVVSEDSAEVFFSNPWLAAVLEQHAAFQTELLPDDGRSSTHLRRLRSDRSIARNAHGFAGDACMWLSPNGVIKIEKTPENQFKVTYWIVEGGNHDSRGERSSFFHVRKNIIIVSHNPESKEITYYVDPASSRACYEFHSRYALETILPVLREEFVQQFPNTLAPMIAASTRQAATTFPQICTQYFQLMPEVVCKSDAWAVFGSVGIEVGLTDSILPKDMEIALKHAQEVVHEVERRKAAPGYDGDAWGEVLGRLQLLDVKKGFAFVSTTPEQKALELLRKAVAQLEREQAARSAVAAQI